MNKKILCVDDEESILKGFKLHLRKGFDLFTANSGEDGLRVFDEEGGFAVVLSDMRMPGIDGAAMLSAIKERNADVVTMLQRDTPILNRLCLQSTMAMFSACYRNLALRNG